MLTIISTDKQRRQFNTTQNVSCDRFHKLNKMKINVKQYAKHSLLQCRTDGINRGR